jgi:diguanylate cyclase (GGDEF)-like protein/PAS domain S-box-containing protein
MSIQLHRAFADLSLPEFETDMVAELVLARRRFEATFQHAPVGIAHVGLDGRFLLVNPRFSEICGHDAETLMRIGFQQITHPDDLNIDEAQLARLNAGEFSRYSLGKRYIRSDGAVIWVNLTVAMVRDEAGRPDFYVAVIEDISELRRASFDAMHDPLTGLLNRRGLSQRAGVLLLDAEKSGEAVSLLFLDLDGFKQLNDRAGHAAGDACLVAVAQLLKSHAAASDVVARVGGDEFLLLGACRDAAAAREAALALCAALAGVQDGVTGSLGLVTAAADAVDLDALIARADGAMLAAKRAGKDRVCVG